MSFNLDFWPRRINFLRFNSKFLPQNMKKKELFRLKKNLNNSKIFIFVRLKKSVFPKIFCPKNFVIILLFFRKYPIFRLQFYNFSHASFFIFPKIFISSHNFCFWVFSVFAKKVQTQPFSITLYEVNSSINKALKVNFRKFNLFDDFL